ncbi:MAG: nitrate reductase associated protein [Candidatus Binatus sp.]|uniref:nitrate reductase associated protein n=1 Tax=Candidatus Binatus sp. TaxID=2811406 RepID=UPI0027251326|nr:nitrate reductase associated protein [Candidatus Binatus sp.]MDO8430809.1 nitrate reductase associated protein [Candidatus Binatus sp.]
MIRKFKFEDEIHESLQCVPMAVRRKLDRVGLKVGLESWKALDRGERLAICHLPSNSPDECDALAVFIREAMLRRFGTEPKSLTDTQRAGAEPPSTPPELLVARARETGFDLNDSIWSRLDGDERFALMKMGADSKPSHNLGAALKEFQVPAAR